MSFIFNGTLNTRPIFENSLRYIRSDVPTIVTEDEIKWLLENNIITVVDLRTDEERAKKICPLENDDRFNYYSMPVSGGNRIPGTANEVSKSYINMVDEKMHGIISLICSCESNVIYFCNAGKDRTGVVSAILLHKAGAPREYITDDYMKSAINLKSMLDDYAKQNSEIDIDVITPKKRYIGEFLDWLTANSDQ